MFQDGLDGSERSSSSILDAGKSGILVGSSQNPVSGPLGLGSGLLGAHPQLPLTSDPMHLTSNPIDKLYLMQVFKDFFFFVTDPADK
jgi:hypothetical protein